MAKRREILYWFRITQVPRGGAPVEVRAQWVDVALPVRDPRPREGPLPLIGRDIMNRDRRELIGDAVPVRVDDALAALRLFGRDEARGWWQGFAVSHRRTHKLAFRRDEGELMPVSYALAVMPELAAFEDPLP
jgi:hypothetical protein